MTYFSHRDHRLVVSINSLGLKHLFNGFTFQTWTPWPPLILFLYLSLYGSVILNDKTADCQQLNTLSKHLVKLLVTFTSFQTQKMALIEPLFLWHILGYTGSHATLQYFIFL